MQKIKYQLSTISSLIVSPRSSLAWYKELEEFPSDMGPSDEFLKKDRLKVIYPFYQYGEYEQWSQDAEYYIPGSSLKGVLCEKNKNHDIMVDDVLIKNKFIVLRNLHKIQNLEKPEQAELNSFFDNVGVEMVKANANLCGKLYIKTAEDLEILLKQANNAAKTKMGQMLEYLSIISERNCNDILKDTLQKTKDSLKVCIEDSNVILLGGYKGLLHSTEIKDLTSSNGDNKFGAIYLDCETSLPHGLTRFDILKN